MKRLFLLLMTVICVLMPMSARADEAWSIKRFDSNIAIQADGTVLVTETLAVDFGSLSKHGIYRDLPYVYESSDGSRVYTEIKPVSVERAGQGEPFEVIQNGANMRLKIGDADTTVSGAQTYRIHYVATGILKAHDGFDELYWNVTGNEWPVPIDQVTARIVIPQPKIVQATCYRGVEGADDACGPPLVTHEQEITFSSADFPRGHGLTVAVGFTAGIVPILTASPPPTFAEQIQWVPLLISFAVVVTSGVWFVVRGWLRYGRDSWYGNRAMPEAGDAPRFMGWGDKESIAPEYAPPANLRPAEIGTLIDERADTLDVSATIVDLAVRGFLTISEEKKPGLFGGKDYKLTKKKNATAELLPYESKLLTALFSTGNEVTLSDLKNKFYKDLADVKKKLYQEVVKKKFFVKDPESVRNTYLIWGFVLLLLGGFGTFALLAFLLQGFFFLTVLIGISMGISVVGVFVIAMSWAMPARTAEGRHAYRQALGYQLFVSNVEKYRTPFMEQKNMFEQVLPYAMVFGVTHQLAKAMKTLGVEPTQPSWYTGVHPFSPVVFANDVNAFSSSLSNAMATSPSSSGSGGGGFSGGGFGGGGGGSW